MSSAANRLINTFDMSPPDQKAGAQESSSKMTTPRTGQKVQVEGRQELFVVLRVDPEQQLADLLRQGAVRKVESGIPLALLRVVSDPEPPQIDPVNS